MSPDLERRFTEHTPKEGQPELCKTIRDEAKVLAYVIINLAPDCEERNLAFTKIEEAIFWANAAIARKG